MTRMALFCSLAVILALVAGDAWSQPPQNGKVLSGLAKENLGAKANGDAKKPEPGKPTTGLVSSLPRDDRYKNAAGKGPRVVAVDGVYDEVPATLQGMRVPFAVINQMPKPSTAFDVLFLGCDEGYVPERFPAEELRKFVARGGVVYGSDLALRVLQPAFPDQLKSFTEFRDPTDLLCDVADEELAKLVGKEVHLEFDLPNWFYITAVGGDVKVHIRTKSTAGSFPMVVSFSHGRGRVVYTSFHNHPSASPPERKLAMKLVMAPLEQFREVVQAPVDGVAGNEPASEEQAKPAEAKVSVTAQDIAKMSVAELAATLSRADSASQSLIVKKLYATRGEEATLALAQAIPSLDVELQAPSRAVLANRMVPLNAETIQRCIQRTDAPELRTALSAALAKRRDRKLLMVVAEMLKDPTTEVADAAQQTLSEATGQNMGPFVGATAEQRAAVINRWQVWLND
jgi:hypothetical protein